ncbi:ATP-binding protein [soil metagenome]
MGSPEVLVVITLGALVSAVVAIAVALKRGRRIAALESGTRRFPAAAAADPWASIGGVELARLADYADVGLLHVGSDGLISVANGPAHRYLGRADDALPGESPIAAFLDHRIDSLFAQVAGSGSGRLDLVLPGEPQRTLLLRAERDAAGTGAWIVVHDVSELRRLRRIRTEFIDNLSHELRTPLTTIRVLSEVLSAEAGREPLPDRVRDSIAKIDVETGHLVQMFTELLDLARIEQGEAPLRRDPVDLGQVVEDAIGRVRPYAERQGVPLRGEVPGSAAARTIEGDAERLGQLLLNLLHNAIKFSEPDAAVAVRVRSSNGHARIEVEDHGPGIPRRDLERIFERFYKVDRARTRGGPGSTGLGLAIARHVAEGHGGRIWAESEEGRGATFIVELPRDAARS